MATLLGGAVRDTLPVLWTLASGDTARDIEEAERLLAERRHNTFKLKIGRRACVTTWRTCPPSSARWATVPA